MAKSDPPIPGVDVLAVRAMSRPIRLDNINCPYCGVRLTPSNRTKEHVIGRRFVPKGRLEREWNLILWACGPCNNRKADLEDDLSAISMMPDSGGKFALEDETLIADAKRKAKNSISRRTGKRVEDSAETISIATEIIPGVQLSVNLVCAPQASDDRLFQLARLQVMAFFFAITYDNQAHVGRFWGEGFYPLLQAKRADWGNGVHVGFMNAVIDWDPRIIGTSADQHFRIAIRKHRSEDCWSWALEWNRQYRLVGFFGNRTAAEMACADFRRLESRTIYQNGEDWIRIRNEVPLIRNSDLMFCYKSEDAADDDLDCAGETITEIPDERG